MVRGPVIILLSRFANDALAGAVLLSRRLMPAWTKFGSNLEQVAADDDLAFEVGPDRVDPHGIVQRDAPWHEV
jgi:hypothetical protein